MISYKTTVTNKKTGERLNTFASRGECTKHYYPLKDERGRFIHGAFEEAERLRKALERDHESILVWTLADGTEVLIQQLRVNAQPLRFVVYRESTATEHWFGAMSGMIKRTGIPEVAINLVLSQETCVSMGGYQFQRIGENKPWLKPDEVKPTLEWLLLCIENKVPRTLLAECCQLLIDQQE